MACQLVNLLTLANFWGLYQLVPAGASWGQLVPVRKVTRAAERDEVGIIHAICMKARSLAQRKGAFMAVQYCHNLQPIQLLLDMKAIKEFVLELGLKENTLDKQQKNGNACGYSVTLSNCA
ncbi:hypothetical protein EDB84DRAFT_1437812 [Lactarius hengduanensis]|nr:hypothetical protein EDB84DRAFT_1437812 [Lactarius hengduanensis]